MTTNEITERRMKTLQRIRVSKREFRGTVAEILGYFLAFSKYAEWTVDDDRAWALLAKQPPGLLGTSIGEICVNPKAFGPWVRRMAPQLMKSPERLAEELRREYLLIGHSWEESQEPHFAQFWEKAKVRPCIFTSVQEIPGITPPHLNELRRHKIRDLLDLTGETKGSLYRMLFGDTATVGRIVAFMAANQMHLKAGGPWQIFCREDAMSDHLMVVHRRDAADMEADVPTTDGDLPFEISDERIAREFVAEGKADGDSCLVLVEAPMSLAKAEAVIRAQSGDEITPVGDLAKKIFAKEIEITLEGLEALRTLTGTFDGEPEEFEDEEPMTIRPKPEPVNLAERIRHEDPKRTDLWDGTLMEMVRFVLGDNHDLGYGLDGNRIFNLFVETEPGFVRTYWHGAPIGGHGTFIVRRKAFARWVRKNWRKFLTTREEHETMMKRVEEDFAHEQKLALEEDFPDLLGLAAIDADEQAGYSREPNILDEAVDSEATGFSSRICAPLLAAGITDVEQLIGRSEEELLEIKGIGHHAIARIRQFLAEHDLHLKGDELQY